jgi:hypothetical protein
MHTGQITIGGSIEIGKKLKIEERLTEAVEVDGGARYSHIIEQILVPEEKVIAFRDEGLTQGYVVFGQPGAGKTYFVKNVLRQLLQLGEADADRRFGGLIIDPKADYPEFVHDEIKRSAHRKNPILIHPEMQRPINILHCGLTAENLAKVVAASCTALAKGADEYFHNNLAVVLSAILVSEEILARKQQGNAPSIKSLLDVLSGFDGVGAERKRILETRIERLELILQGKIKGFELTAAERVAMARCVDNLRAFLKEEKSYVVVQLFKQAFEAIGRLDFLSAQSKIASPNLYDDIINNGRVVVASVPPSETYARAVFTLMKNIFQKVVLDRFARYGDDGNGRGISNNVRPVFLICDEYHLSASDSPDCGVGDSTFLSLARTFGCFSLFATQGLDQLKTSPIGERWESVIGLFRAKFFFTVGDTSTAAFACDIGGEQQSVFIGSSLNQGGDGKTWGMSDQLTTKQHLPKYVLLRSLGRGQAAIVGSLDGRSKPSVEVVSI